MSAVTKQITVKDKYQKQLAELDLMAEDWVDTDEVPACLWNANVGLMGHVQAGVNKTASHATRIFAVHHVEYSFDANPPYVKATGSGWSSVCCCFESKSTARGCCRKSGNGRGVAHRRSGYH